MDDFDSNLRILTRNISINKLENIRFRDLFEHFSKCDNDFKTIKSINHNFEQHAEQISKGKSEFLYKEGFLDIYWPPGEFEYIKLVADRKLDQFYTEFKQHFLKFCKSKKSKEIFLESVELNKKMMRLPWSDDDEMLDLNYNMTDEPILPT